MRGGLETSLYPVKKHNSYHAIDKRTSNVQHHPIYRSNRANVNFSSTKDRIFFIRLFFCSFFFGGGVGLEVLATTTPELSWMIRLVTRFTRHCSFRIRNVLCPLLQNAKLRQVTCTCLRQKIITSRCRVQILLYVTRYR